MGAEVGAIEIQDEQELADLLKSLGVTTVDNLPPTQIPPLNTGETTYETLPRQTIVREPLTVSSAAILVREFRHQLLAQGVTLDLPVIIDLLASYLSSQFILFAGPSGTGKSTAARSIQAFFAPPDSRAIINGRRQLLGPEDVAGYYSPLGHIFVAGPDLAALDHLGRPNAAAPCPSLLVEEVNLSPPEGYLNPWIHGLSGLSAEQVKWSIFADDLAGKAQRSGSLVFEPFPRLLGTINVDATAPAPAPKVAARACVVLLEPMETTDLQTIEEVLRKQYTAVELTANGASAVGNPLSVLSSTAYRSQEIQYACLRLCAALEWGQKPFEDDWVPESTPIRGISRRQLAQIVVYSAWFDVLAQGTAQIEGTDAPDPQVGAENAILHFVLPSLDAVRFSIALGILQSLPLSSRTGTGLGGILKSRVKRLQNVDDDSEFTGRILDFWDRLS